MVKLAISNECKMFIKDTLLKEVQGLKNIKSGCTWLDYDPDYAADREHGYIIAITEDVEIVYSYYFDHASGGQKEVYKDSSKTALQVLEEKQKEVEKIKQEEEAKQKALDEEITIGKDVIVFKGRKFPKGLTGKVIKMYQRTFNYNTVTYAVLETGENIDIKNLKVVM